MRLTQVSRQTFVRIDLLGQEVGPVPCWLALRVFWSGEFFWLFHNVHRFLSLRFRKIRVDSQIATDLAVREFAFVAMFNDVVHYPTLDTCMYIQDSGPRIRAEGSAFVFGQASSASRGMVNFLRRLANGPLASVRNTRVLLGIQLQQQTTYAARQPAPESRTAWSCQQTAPHGPADRPTPSCHRVSPTRCGKCETFQRFHESLLPPVLAARSCRRCLRASFLNRRGVCGAPHKGEGFPPD